METRALSSLPLGGGIRLLDHDWILAPRSLALLVTSTAEVSSDDVVLKLSAQSPGTMPRPLAAEPIEPGQGQWLIEREISYLFAPRSGEAYPTDLTVSAPPGYLLAYPERPGEAAPSLSISFDARALPVSPAPGARPLREMLLLPRAIQLGGREYTVDVPLGDQAGTMSFCAPGLKPERGETIWLEMTSTSPQRFRMPPDLQARAEERFSLVSRPLRGTPPGLSGLCSAAPLGMLSAAELAGQDRLTLPYTKPVLVYLERTVGSNQLYRDASRDHYLAWIRALDSLREARLIEIRQRPGFASFSAARPKPSQGQPLLPADAQSLYVDLFVVASQQPAAPARLVSILRDAAGRRTHYGLSDGVWPDIVVIGTRPERPDCGKLSRQILDELSTRDTARHQGPRLVLLYDVAEPIEGADGAFIDCRFEPGEASPDATASPRHRIMVTSSLPFDDQTVPVDIAPIWAAALDDLRVPLY